MLENELKELQNMKLKVSMPDLDTLANQQVTTIACIKEQNGIFRQMTEILERLDRRFMVHMLRQERTAQNQQKREALLDQLTKEFLPSLRKGFHRMIDPKPSQYPIPSPVRTASVAMDWNEFKTVQDTIAAAFPPYPKRIERNAFLKQFSGFSMAALNAAFDSLQCGPDARFVCRKSGRKIWALRVKPGTKPGKTAR